MSQFRFTQAAIEEHLVEVGADIRPAIEARAERQKLGDFGLWLNDTWPALFENVDQGPAAFCVTRKFACPGKGEVEMPTFTLTPRGPVFTFPYKLRVLGGEEIELPECKDVVIRATDQFKRLWGQCKQVRLGKVTTYSFDTSPESPVAVVAERFTRLAGSFTEIHLRFNRPSDDFNRVVYLDAADLPAEGDQEPPRIIRVGVDVNNRDMEEDLSKDKKLRILHEADAYCQDDLFSLLNGDAEQ